MSSIPPPSDSFSRQLHDLRISVTDRCNFRCPYCMPAEVFGERYQFLPKTEVLSFEEIERLAEDVFEQMSGTAFPLEKVLAGLEAAERVGLTPIKINCVVQRGINDESLLELARRFRGPNHILRFIEFMDVGTLNGWKLEQVVPAAEILARVDRELPLQPVEPSYVGEVARRYAYRDCGG